MIFDVYPTIESNLSSMVTNMIVIFVLLMTLPLEVDGVGGFFWGSSSSGSGKKDTGSENNSPGFTFSKKKESDGPTISDSNDDWRTKIGVNMRSKSSASRVDDSHLYISEVTHI